MDARKMDKISSRANIAMDCCGVYFVNFFSFFSLN